MGLLDGNIMSDFSAGKKDINLSDPFDFLNKKHHFEEFTYSLPSLPDYRHYLHLLLQVVTRLLFGEVNALPFLQKQQNYKTEEDSCFTDWLV